MYNAKVSVLYNDDFHSVNTFENPDKVKPSPLSIIGDGKILILKKHSLTVLTASY